MINHIIIISDLHCGDKFSICPPSILLHEGGTYKHSKVQELLWPIWEEFTNKFIPHCTKDKYNLIINGDALEGVHHNMVHAITNDPADHFAVAEELLRPLMMKAEQTIFIKGTSAHAGKSGNEEERLARNLKDLNVYNVNGRYTHYALDYNLGKYRINFMHHLGTTARQNSEATAITAEIHELMTEIAKWEDKPRLPDVLVRSHRHRHSGAWFPLKGCMCYGFSTAAWQVKTEHVFKIAARIKYVHIGGHYIGLDKQGDLSLKHFVESIGLQAEEYNA